MEGGKVVFFGKRGGGGYTISSERKTNGLYILSWGGVVEKTRPAFLLLFTKGRGRRECSSLLDSL